MMLLFGAITAGLGGDDAKAAKLTPVALAGGSVASFSSSSVVFSSSATLLLFLSSSLLATAKTLSLNSEFGVSGVDDLSIIAIPRAGVTVGVKAGMGSLLASGEDWNADQAWNLSGCCCDVFLPLLLFFLLPPLLPVILFLRLPVVEIPDSCGASGGGSFFFLLR